MRLFVEQLVNGLERGSVYALWTVGYGLVYQVLGLMHFAHGDTLLLGLYMAVVVVVTLTFPIAAAIVIVLVVGAVLAMIVERTVYRPFVRRNDNISAFIAALAAAYILRNIATLWAGRQSLQFPSLLPAGHFQIAGLALDSTPFVALAVAIAVVALFQLFLKNTRHGQAIVLISQDRTASTLMGIPVARITTLVYGLSGLIGMVGALLFISAFGTLHAGIGFIITLKAFVAAIIGGIGRIHGAIVGGLLLGMLEALIIGYVTSVFVDAITFAILVVILLVRPSGLFGRKELVRL